MCRFEIFCGAIFETPPYTAQKKLDSIFATQKLRATIEEQRKNASAFGDVAKRLGQLNREIERSGLPASCQLTYRTS